MAELNKYWPRHATTAGTRLYLFIVGYSGPSRRPDLGPLQFRATLPCTTPAWERVVSGYQNPTKGTLTLGPEKAAEKLHYGRCSQMRSSCSGEKGSGPH